MGSQRQNTPADDAATRVERASDRELVVTRRFDAPRALVFRAWTEPALFSRWWAPKSSGLAILSCVMDVRVGGRYRLEFGHPASEKPMAFFGRYLEVAPGARLVWTNEEGGEDGAVTTVTFADEDGATRVVYAERHASKAALDEALQGMESAMPEQYRQLDALLASLA